MTTNEQIKCPMCGGKMSTFWGSPDKLCCRAADCPMRLFSWEDKHLIKVNTLIQSRIDKAVAAAVQEERERICENLSSRRKYFMECISVNSDTTAHQEPLGHINELAFLIQWLRVQINTGATK